MTEELTTTSKLDEKRKISGKGTEYWMGRDIQQLLGYDGWVNFAKVVDKAKVACEKAGVVVTNHFVETNEKITLGKGAVGKRATYFLSRYACYLIAMNGDPTKSQIALAQTYFAVQTRRQEIADQATPEGERLQWRERLTDATKGLHAAAKQSGVQHYGLFNDAGYRGLYGMGLAGIKKQKGIGADEHLFDRAGSSELAANFFKATQAKERLARLGVKDEISANKVHQTVGAEVRQTIEKLGNTMPENLPAEPSIKLLKKKLAPKAIK